MVPRYRRDSFVKYEKYQALLKADRLLKQMKNDNLRFQNVLNI